MDDKWGTPILGHSYMVTGICSYVNVGMGQHLLSSIFSEMNIHLPAILGFIRGTRVPFNPWRCV